MNDMKDVLIINAGGFGRNTASSARADIAHGKEWTVRGFLDTRADLPPVDGLPVVGDPFTYRYQAPGYIVCALGDPGMRRKYSAPLLAQGAVFMNLLPGALLSERVRMGQGCLFERGVSIGTDAVLGDFVIMLSTSIIGYDVRIGSYSTVGSFVFMGGGVQIGENVVVHPHATILPGVKVGDGAVVGAGSVVIANVPAGVTVFGNPAKRFEFK
ncbi:MAG: NeuD/PglB/VioB family sugar acetyltransferase [Burkholderiales bacterium]|jgi:sugar O-acyltransferase (sialic acid O-acetyltransferase NeuD family)|nr:NeuD/PglB/VioB family sugar acetyltransferase [Burkholderiales bacterium]